MKGSTAQPTRPRRLALSPDAAIALLLVAGVWLTRALAANSFITWDEPAWVYRSAKFLLALSRGELRGTLLVGHPGVLAMWCGALGLAWQRLVGGPTVATQLAAVDALPSLQVHDQATLRLLAALLPAAKAPLPLFHAAIAAGLYLLLQPLLGRARAAVAVAFVALDPYYIALSRLLHMDALASGLMLVSVVGVLLYSHSGRRRHLLLSGAAAGLAAVTKSYGVLVAPFLALLLPAVRLRQRRSSGRPPIPPRRGNGGGVSLLRDLALWGGFAVASFVAAWPAMWVAPVQTLRAILGLSLEYATAPGDATASFFLGASGTSPGAAFYPLSMAFRTTPLVLAGTLLALLLLWRRGAPAGRPARPAGADAGAPPPRL
ncbi:MAG: glycosyltransferase family 39 protein, partial [Anaerolineae bacterium]